MSFLDKLDLLMNEHGLNKSTLSKASGVPYTTIDGFYKKGYENTKMSTIRKLASFFSCSIDYLIDDSVDSRFVSNAQMELSEVERQLIIDFRSLDDSGKELILHVMSNAVPAHSGKNKTVSDMETAQ